MRIDGYGGVKGPGVPPDPKSEGAGRANQANPNDRLDDVDKKDNPDADPTADSLEISPKAQELLAETKQKKDAPKTEDDVRPEKVERARQVLQNGLYNDKGAVEKTANAIAKVFSADA